MKIIAKTRCYECGSVTDREELTIEKFIEREGKRGYKEFLATGKVVFPKWGNVEYVKKNEPKPH